MCIRDRTNASVDDVTEISQEEALEKASTLLNQLYGIDTDTLAVETEHDQALDGNGETFTTDHITYRDEAAGISYMASVNLQNGEIKTVSAEKDTGSNYSKEIAENAATVSYTHLLFIYADRCIRKTAECVKPSVCACRRTDKGEEPSAEMDCSVFSKI